MTDAPIRCPNCGQPVDPPTGAAGEKLRCPKCRFEFLPQASVWAPVAGPSAAAAPAAGAEKPHLKAEDGPFPCPRCGVPNPRDARYCGSCGKDLHPGLPLEPAARRRKAAGAMRQFAWVAGVVALLALGAWAWLEAREAAPVAPSRAPAAAPSRAAEGDGRAPVPPAPAPMPPAAASAGAAPPELEEEFFANGKLMARGMKRALSDGRRVKCGVWTNYWANGAVNTYGHYEDGEKVGLWPFYVEEGTLCITNRYRPPSAVKALAESVKKGAARAPSAPPRK